MKRVTELSCAMLGGFLASWLVSAVSASARAEPKDATAEVRTQGVIFVKSDGAEVGRMAPGSEGGLVISLKADAPNEEYRELLLRNADELEVVLRARSSGDHTILRPDRLSAISPFYPIATGAHCQVTSYGMSIGPYGRRKDIDWISISAYGNANVLSVNDSSGKQRINSRCVVGEEEQKYGTSTTWLNEKQDRIFQVGWTDGKPRAQIKRFEDAKWVLEAELKE